MRFRHELHDRCQLHQRQRGEATLVHERCNGLHLGFRQLHAEHSAQSGLNTGQVCDALI